MASNRESVRLLLTPQQRQLVKSQTNRDVEAIELSVEELEERIAPAKKGWKAIL
jgi:hypothetical protein